jgi:V8-like Glu-specific endopeptidase
MMTAKQHARVLSAWPASVLQISLALVGLGSLLSPYQPAQAAVIGRDDRVTPSYSFMQNTGLAPVGQLEIQKADGLYYTCTFAVVGRNIGLTNAHCLVDEQGRTPPQIKAYALQHGRDVLALANVDVFWLGSRIEPTTLGEAPRDWAIIRFTTNLGNITGTFGNLGWYDNIARAGQSVVGRKANLVGYSGDWPTAKAFQLGSIRGYTPGGHFNCNLPEVRFGVVLHDCDMTEGSSGSAIFNQDKLILALNSATLTFTNRTQINAAVPLERFMPALAKLRETGADGRTIVPVP